MQNFTDSNDFDFKELGEDLKERTRCEALMDPTSAYFQTALKVIAGFRTKEKAEKSKKMNKSKLYSDVALDSDSINYLQDKFGYQIDAKASGVPYHSAFAEVFGKCMFKRMLDTKSWAGEDVVGLEGDLRIVAAKSAKWLHVCRFGLTSADRSRYMEENAFVRRTLVSKNYRMQLDAIDLQEQLDVGFGSNVCTDGRKCEIGADTVVLQPQYLQLGARQVADFIVKHSASRAKGWFFFDVGMLAGGSKVFLDGKFRYVVDLEEGLVNIFPVDSDIVFCSYGVMNMLSFVRNRSFEHKGETFFIELHGDDKGVMNWVMTRTHEVYDFNEEVNDLPLWSEDVGSNSVIMSYLTHVPGQEDEGAKRVVLRTNGLLVEKVIARLLPKDESAITIANARIALRDFSDQYIELGSFVRLPKGLDGILFEFIARGCHRRAKYAKVSMLVEEAVAKSSYAAVEKGLTGSFVEGVMNLARVTGESIVSLLKRPINEVLEAARTESWDASIVPEEPVTLMRMLWDPATRGISSLGSTNELLNRSSKVSGKRIIKQAWDWFKTQSVSTSGSGMDVVDEEVVREEFFEVEKRPVLEELGEDRKHLVQSLVVSYDAVERAKVSEVALEIATPKPVKLTPAVLMDDPYSAMQEDFDVNFPGLALCDFNVRPYLAAVSDREYNNQLVGLKAKGYEEAPRSTLVKRTVLRSGLSGPRPMIMSEVGAAFGKRVGGAPNYQFPHVESQEIFRAVNRFFDVCFKEGWQDEVKRRVAQGLWQPRSASVNTVVSKMTPSVVSRASSESFTYSDVIMTEYEAMFKRQPKDKLESATAFEHTPCQTIMYQKSKSTNALFSSILGEVHDLIDAILRPGILINMRRDKEYAEKVWNGTRARRRKYCKQTIDADISQCDKSQTRFNLGLYFEVMKRLGMPEEISQYWELVMGRKRAVASQVSFVVEFLAQVLSGLFATISMNSIIVAVATVDSLELEVGDLLNMMVSGDDVVVALASRKNVQLTADRYASMYNFEVKVFEPEVLYWCGRYIVNVGGYEFFVKDPEKAFSSLAKDQPASYEAEEAYQSFVDDTKVYAYEEILFAVANAVKKRHNRNVAPVSICRGIATVRRSKDLFMSRFQSGLFEYAM